MNQSQEQRLEEIFRKNENKGIAIAITGCWGVGKTFAWNKFRNQYLSRKKYVYVSLFGLESLSDLKTHIYSHIENNSSPIEIPRWLRGLPSILKETKISQFGVSASANIIDSLMFGQVKDAIICFDDFERMSKKLDIKDVMGLANQLKLERNCQVVLILDESKSDDDNKKKYAEYKEKLIDETIKINSVESLIRAKTNDIDKELIDLMVKFAEELEIHNFRFFQKIIKLYKEFRAQLPEDAAYSTKKNILIRILQGYFIEDFGKKHEFDWSDIKLVDERNQKDWSEEKVKTYRRLKLLDYAFVYADEWLFEFKKWFEQKGNPDFRELKNLVNSDLISEKNDLLKKQLQSLMDKWKNLEVDENYCENLFIVSSQLVGIESLGLLEFSADLLKKFGKPELSRKMKNLIIEYLKTDLEKHALDVYDRHLRFPIRHETIFHRYIKLWRFNNQFQGLPSLFEVLKPYILNGGVKNKAKVVISSASQQDWEDFIFSESSVDDELQKLHKGEIMTRILQQTIDVNLRPLIKQHIEAILINKISSSSDPANKKNIEFVIENFKKERLI